MQGYVTLLFSTMIMIIDSYDCGYIIEHPGIEELGKPDCFAPLFRKG